MSTRLWIVCLAASAGLSVAPGARADDGRAPLVVGCPAGQVLQSVNITARSVQCVPIPDVGALQGAISSEAAARLAADNAEATARLKADTGLFGDIAELRAKVEETSIAGSWAFTGSQSCVSLPPGVNFDPTTLRPPPGVVGSVNFVTVSGIRVFNAPDAQGNGTGQSSAEFHSISTGQASISTLDNTFTYQVVGDSVVIDDNDAVGAIIKGGIGGTLQALGVPQFVGRISKDRRTILVTQGDLVIEQSVFTPPAGAPPGFVQTTTNRVCQRIRTLIKID